MILTLRTEASQQETRSRLLCHVVSGLTEVGSISEFCGSLKSILAKSAYLRTPGIATGDLPNLSFIFSQ